MALGVGICELTKRNILTVWIFVIDSVVVIEAGVMEGVGRIGVELRRQFLDDVMRWLGSSRAKIRWSE